MPRRRSAQEIENNRSRSRSRDNKDKSRSRESEDDERSEDTDENEAVASDIRNAFIEFFAQLKHEKGFVFTPQDRQKLIKQQDRTKRQNRHLRLINWLAKSNWDQADQIANIKEIFERKKPALASEQQIESAKSIFEKVLFIFCSEVTKELYELLMLLLEESLNRKQKHLIPALMDQVYDENSRFVFFGFKFSKYFKLPEDPPLVRTAYRKLGTDIISIFSSTFANYD